MGQLDQVLSQEEVDQLLNMVASTVEENAPISTPDADSTYDLAGRLPRSGQDYNALDIVHSRFTHGLEQSLSPVAKRHVKVSLLNTDFARCDKLLSELQLPTLCVVVRRKPLPGHCVIALDSSLVGLLIDAVFGAGVSGPLQIDAPSKYTPLELTFIFRVFERVCAELTLAWEPLYPFEFAIERIDQTPAHAFSWPSSEIAFKHRFGVTIGDWEGYFTMVMPYAQVEPIMHRIAFGWPLSDDAETHLIYRRCLVSSLRSLPLRIGVQLGSANLSFRQVDALRIGDVIQLNVMIDEQLPISVGGVRKFFGTLTMRKGHFAMAISKSKNAKHRLPANVAKLTLPIYPKSELAGLLDVPVRLAVELAATTLPLSDVVNLKLGTVIKLDKLAGEPLELLANGKLIGMGEVVVVNEHFGLRIINLVSEGEEVA